MNWLWKLLGYHVCEEFTQWERKWERVWVTPVKAGLPLVSLRYLTDECWQERRCTLCGKVQQEPLKHFDDRAAEKRHA